MVAKGLITSTIANFDQTLLIQVRASLQLVSIAIPFLKLAQNPSVTILTSNQGTAPDPQSPVMSTAAAMVQMMIKCTALETAFHGVRVNGVAAGVIKSKARTKGDQMEMQLTDAEND